MNIYQNHAYFSIDTDAKEIRLLIIAPGEDIEELCCVLVGADVRNPPPYKALSYTWGNSSATRRINIDGRSFFVRKNLELALRRFRSPEEEIWIWIDAICINQADLEERSTHITYMHHVYQQAEEVLIWLGDEEDDSTWALTKLNRLWTMEQSSDDTTKDEWLEIFSPKLTTAVNNIFGRPWWTRVWTIQEFVCAENLAFYVGPARISAEPLYYIATYMKPPVFYDLSSQMIENWGSSAQLNFLFTSRRSRQSSLPSTLVQTLVHVRSRHSSDPRDKVFAILNILPESEVPIVPDYSKNADVVFTDVARHIVHTSRKLTLLRLCERAIFSPQAHLRKAYQMAEVPGIPTWVPDWTRMRQTVPLSGGYDRESTHSQVEDPIRYNADGDSMAVLHTSRDPQELVVSGIIYDIVRDCFPPWVESAASVFKQMTKRTFYQVLETWLMEKLHKSSYPEMHSKMELLWRTLVANEASNPEKTTAEDVVDFTQWLSSQDDDTLPSHLLRSIPCLSRRLFVTGKGLLGLGPFNTSPNDMMCILLGSSVPMIIRNTHPIYLQRKDLCQVHPTLNECFCHGCFNGKALVGTERINNVVGESYVHGIMEGQVMDELKSGGVQLEHIVLK